MLGVKVLYTTPKCSAISMPQYGIPRFMNQIAAKLDIMDVASLNESHDILTKDDVKKLFELVTDAERHYPIVVLADDNRGKYCGYLLDAKRLKRRIGLIAHVYTISSNMLEEWEALISCKWGILPGCVRTYNKGFSIDDEIQKHPYTSITKIMAASIYDDNNDEIIAGKAYEVLLTNMIVNSCLRNRIDWKQLGFKFFYVANRERESYFSTIDKKHIEMCNELLEEYKQLGRLGCKRLVFYRRD